MMMHSPTRPQIIKKARSSSPAPTSIALFALSPMRIDREPRGRDIELSARLESEGCYRKGKHSAFKSSSKAAAAALKSPSSVHVHWESGSPGTPSPQRVTFMGLCSLGWVCVGCKRAVGGSGDVEEKDPGWRGGSG
uniref:Uncharacterized protein n=1 Tax=Knipowitschia caucasica TaxID=637954 RepID=A0AAV2JI40_KNICA